MGSKQPHYLMLRIIFSLLLFCSLNVYGEALPPPKEIGSNITPIEISNLFIEPLNKGNIRDLVDKEEKVDKCVVEYINKQERSWAKNNQNNLYDLIRNFGMVVSKLYGNKPIRDNMSYQEKLEILANVQCEVYYGMGVLK